MAGRAPADGVEEARLDPDEVIEAPKKPRKIDELRYINPAPKQTPLEDRKPHVWVEKDTVNYTSCIFPSSFFQVIEAGKIFQRATIPYRFLDVLSQEKLAELTDDYFLIFCARNGHDEPGSPAFYDTKEPQVLIEEMFNQYTGDSELLRVASGLNAAIRTYVNWHKHCMLITSDFFDHRRDVITRILLEFHYELPFFSPKHEALHTIFATRYYSYALSLALARGYSKAYPPSKKMTMRGEAKRVDAGKAWTIYSEVETLFLRYVDYAQREVAVDEVSGEDPGRELDTPVSSEKLRARNNILTGRGSDSRARIDLLNWDSSPSARSPFPTSGRRTGSRRTGSRLRAAPRGSEFEKIKALIPSEEHCRSELDKLPDAKKDYFAECIQLLAKSPKTSTDDGKIIELKDKLDPDISPRCYITVSGLLKQLKPFIPADKSPDAKQFPLSPSRRGEGFADVDPEKALTDDEEDELDAAMAAHMLDGP